MVKTLMLLPVRDNRGRRLPRRLWRSLDERFLQFGGSSWRNGVRGVWQAGGRVYRDRSREYTVSLTSWLDFPAWLEVVLWAREAFDQQAIYIEVAGVPEILSRHTA
jgi:hypothetical protein